MLCVIAKLESAACVRLNALRRALEACGIPGKELYGHITLASYVGDDSPAFVAACRELLAGFPAFSVRYERVEVLAATSIIAALPRNDGALARVHRAIAERWGPELDSWTGTSAWKPHTTLLYRPEGELEVLAARLQERFTPFSALVERIEFSRVLEEGYHIADTLLLSRGDARGEASSSGGCL